MFVLPENAKVGDKEALSVASLCGSYTAANHEISKKKVLIYGLGNYFKANEKYINDNFYIEAFIDKAKDGYYAGKRIIKIEQIKECNYDVIVIMVQNIQESLNIAKTLRHECNVPVDKILIGVGVINHSLKRQSIVYTQDDKLMVSFNGISCKIGSLDEYNNVYEVLFNQTYNYYINNDREDVVIDIGMNIGDATLYFLNKDKVRKVYGFEPFIQTFMSAEDNLKDYLDDEDRLEIFQFGIGGQNEKRNILYNKEMSCGQSTIEQTIELSRNRYNQMELISSENDVWETIEVRRASEILQPIIKKHTQNNIVLKMDCEGDEYGIMKELMETKLLGKIDFIMLEWHYNGKEILLKYLRNSGFSYWCSDRSVEMGLIYAYRNTKNV
jgi:FkbM family methyltransferase